MLIIGCDFHPSGQQVFGMNDETGEIFADQWLDHSGKAVEEFYASLPASNVPCFPFPEEQYLLVHRKHLHIRLPSET